ncbi:MAG: hypothetical protein E7462_04945 [Ruminococcaceae bacterium]|nr:hypothetical protein [Oscillospiraceae bacterium]
MRLDDEREGQFVWGDFSREDAENALKNNSITVYSSHPIRSGTFVSTSYTQAWEYAGGNKNSKVYSKEVPLDDVAWINGDEGEYAKVEDTDRADEIIKPSESGTKRSVRDEISQEKLDAFMRKRPIKASKKDWAKVSGARIQKYARSSETDIPDVDFFLLAEYNKLNEGYTYIVRNYGRDAFDIVGKYRIKHDMYQAYDKEMKSYDPKNGAGKTGARTDPSGSEQGTVRGGSEHFGYRGKLRANDSRNGQDGASVRKDTFGRGVSDSGRVKKSERDTDSYSNRALLANAFESITKSSPEYEKIQEYKGRIRIINEYEEKLAKLNAEIRKITFGTKGTRDMAKLRKLQAEAAAVAADIDRNDRILLNIEAAEPLQKIIQRERKKAAQT